MAFERTGEGFDPVSQGGGTHHEEYRVGRSTVVGTGTMACPDCDAPVPLHVPAPAALEAAP